MYVPMYRSLWSIFTRELRLKATPRLVRYPCSFSHAMISDSVMPDAYRSKIFVTMGPVMGSISYVLSGAALYPYEMQAPPGTWCFFAASKSPSSLPSSRPSSRPLQDAFKDYAFRSFHYVFRDVFHADTVLFRSVFIKCDLFPVPSEPVNLPDDDDRELMFCRVRQHPLEFLTVVIRACLCPVAIFPDDRIAFCLSVLMGGSKLSLDGCFLLFR